MGVKNRITILFQLIDYIKNGKNKLYMNKSLCKNLWNVDMNKTIKFGVCKCFWSGDFWEQVKKTREKKPH